MARLTVGQKAQRLLRFLMGLGNAANMRELQQYGFDQAALDEGWALLRQTSTSRLRVQRSAGPARDQIELLDAWENHWFPIASAVLLRHHPAVHARVFQNLGQTEGKEVVLSVSTLVERIDELTTSGDTAALATLNKHGVGEETLGVARGLLVQVMQPPPVEPPPAADTPVFVQATEDAMWSYYLQWSAIARRAIKDRRQLREARLPALVAQRRRRGRDPGRRRARRPGQPGHAGRALSRAPAATPATRARSPGPRALPAWLRQQLRHAALDGLARGLPCSADAGLAIRGLLREGRELGSSPRRSAGENDSLEAVTGSGGARSGPAPSRGVPSRRPNQELAADVQTHARFLHHRRDHMRGSRARLRRCQLERGREQVRGPPA